MYLRKLRLEYFRCHKDSEFEFSPGINIIHGRNGVGKTCLLEAVFFLSTVRSPRASKEKELIMLGEHLSKISAGFSDDMDRTLEIMLSDTDKRSIRLDGAVLATPRELLGIMPSVFFSPRELELLLGGPSERRRFTDMALCQLKPGYITALSQYRKLHESKTKLLRLIAGKASFLEALPDFNRKMADVAAVLARYRREFIESIAERAEAHHDNISGGTEKLTLTYRTHVTTADETFELLESKTQAETSQQQCLYGPHRDDIEAFLNDHPVKHVASQGQTRTAALAIKLAERDIFYERLASWPILLLDDVLSELDEGRRNYILGHIEDGQVLITCCDEHLSVSGAQRAIKL